MQVVFEALKMGGLRNDIALDDIALIAGACGPAPPEPTNVPPPTTARPIPSEPKYYQHPLYTHINWTFYLYY